MSVSIKPYLDIRKKKKDGTTPIYMRLTKNGKSRYISVGISVKENQWDAKEKVVKKHPMKRRYNKEIWKLQRELEENFYQAEENGRVTLKSLKESVVNDNHDSILNYAEEYHKQLEKERRLYEYKKMKTIINNLESYLDGNKVTPEELNADFIEGFQDHLLRVEGNNPNTTRRKLTTLKAFFTDLQKKELLKTDPFLQVQKVKKKPTNKTRLTYDQIESIRDLNLEEGSNLWHIRNYFMYSFYNAGIRFSDICTLTWKNIIDGRLVYSMHKTGEGKSIKQLEEHNRILDYYWSEDNKPADYIFPILKNKHSDPFELRKEIQSRNAVVNKQLKEIASMAGIETNVSFHVSRHSFSQYALKQGMDIYSISKALAHGDLKVTQEYLNSFDEDLLDNSMDKLFGK